MGNVDVAEPVHFGKAEECLVEPAAAVEVELLAGGEDRHRIGRDAEEVSSQQVTAMDALFDGEPVVPAFAGPHDVLGHAADIFQSRN